MRIPGEVIFIGDRVCQKDLEGFYKRLGEGAAPLILPFGVELLGDSALDLSNFSGVHQAPECFTTREFLHQISDPESLGGMVVGSLGLTAASVVQHSPTVVVLVSPAGSNWQSSMLARDALF